MCNIVNENDHLDDQEFPRLLTNLQSWKISQQKRIFFLRFAREKPFSLDKIVIVPQS